LAALSAQRLSKNELAYQYGKKALDAQSSAQNKAFISTTLANLGKFPGAMDYIDQALKENPNNVDFQRLRDEYSQHLNSRRHR
jgi:tetratricopeptide (TPR) repeat protein